MIITSLQAFLLLVSVGSLLYLYVSHITWSWSIRFCFSSSFVFVLFLSHHDVVAAPERILVHLYRVQVGVRVAALSLRKDKDDEGNKKKQKIAQKRDEHQTKST